MSLNLASTCDLGPSGGLLVSAVSAVRSCDVLPRRADRAARPLGAASVAVRVRSPEVFHRTVPGLFLMCGVFFFFPPLVIQLLIIDGQQLRTDPATVMDGVQKFLGVSRHYNYSEALT